MTFPHPPPESKILEALTPLDTNQLMVRANSLRDTIEFHLEQFRKETGFFPNVSVSRVEYAGYGDQAKKLLHAKVEISIDL